MRHAPAALKIATQRPTRILVAFPDLGSGTATVLTKEKPIFNPMPACAA